MCSWRTVGRCTRTTPPRNARTIGSPSSGTTAPRTSARHPNRSSRIWSDSASAGSPTTGPATAGRRPTPGRDVASAAADVAAVADALGVERFAVMSHSGGAHMPWPVLPCCQNGSGRSNRGWARAVRRRGTRLLRRHGRRRRRLAARRRRGTRGTGGTRNRVLRTTSASRRQTRLRSRVSGPGFSTSYARRSRAARAA
jgi:hypothetical protein